MQLCSTVSPQVLTQLTASHTVPGDDLFPFFLHYYHIHDPWKGPVALSKTRPLSPSQQKLTHIHWALRSRVLHVFPKEIWRNPSPRALFPPTRWVCFSIPQSPALPHAPCSLLQCPGGGGDASHGHCSLKQMDIKNPKPHKPAILGSPCALFLSLEPCASPSPHPLRPVTKCLPVAPSCTPQAASSSSSSSYSSSQ